VNQLNRLKEPLEDTFIAELAAALIAAFSAALLTSLVNFFNQHQVNPLAYMRFMFLAAASYLLAAALLHVSWPTLFRRAVPNWIPISLIGSLLFVMVRLTPGIIRGWHDPLRLESSLSSYLLNEIDAAKSVVIVLIVMTLPLTALAYYLTRRVVARRARTR
jgi:hypothetical protein